MSLNLTQKMRRRRHCYKQLEGNASHSYYFLVPLTVFRYYLVLLDIFVLLCVSFQSVRPPQAIVHWYSDQHFIQFWGLLPCGTDRSGYSPKWLSLNLQGKYWSKLKVPQKIAIMDILFSVLEFATSYNSYTNLRMRMRYIPAERFVRTQNHSTPFAFFYSSMATW